MALIECPDCRKQISDKARSCPQCGSPIKDKTVANQNARRGRGWIWSLLFLVAFVSLGVWVARKLDPAGTERLLADALTPLEEFASDHGIQTRQLRSFLNPSGSHSSTSREVDQETQNVRLQGVIFDEKESPPDLGRYWNNLDGLRVEYFTNIGMIRNGETVFRQSGSRVSFVLNTTIDDPDHAREYNLDMTVRFEGTYRNGHLEARARYVSGYSQEWERGQRVIRNQTEEVHIYPPTDYDESTTIDNERGEISINTYASVDNRDKALFVGHYKINGQPAREVNNYYIDFYYDGDAD